MEGSDPILSTAMPVAEAAATRGRRAFWAALLVMHAAGLVTVVAEWSSGAIEATAGGLRAAAMGAAIVFFVLKIVDVPALRLNPGWRSVVASALAVALLHMGVLERAWQGRWAAMPAQAGVVLFLGVMFETEVVRRCVAVLTGTWPPVRRRAPRPARCDRRAAIWTLQHRFRPYESAHIIEVAASRAPPWAG